MFKRLSPARSLLVVATAGLLIAALAVPATASSPKPTHPTRQNRHALTHKTSTRPARLYGPDADASFMPRPTGHTAPATTRRGTATG